jgi:conjugal transfer ATP-binding protein TraC
MKLFGDKSKNTTNIAQENIVEPQMTESAPSLVTGEKATNRQVKEDSAEKKLAKGIPSVMDIIAPSAIEVDYNFIKIGDKYFRTLFVSGYPRFVGANWLEPIINFDHTITITMFYYPMNARNVLDDLRRKIAEMEATINIAREKGKVIDPAVQAALGDAKSLQEQLVKGIEKFFHFSFYVTISADSLPELNSVSYQVESTLGSLSLVSKKATLEMESAFQTSVPVCLDKLQVIRNMDTTSVATTFPFTSSELTSNEGILYGVNKHNGSLIIFDRFSLENANSVIFAKSGAGKSYLVKLEALRYLLFGVDILVLDPENEYKRLCEAVGGEYIDFSVNSVAKINPFDLPKIAEQEDQLGLKILSLHALLKIMIGELNSSETAVLDKALVETYKLKGITADPATQQKEPPLMEDLYKVLEAMDEAASKSIAEKMERYIKGSLAGVFDQRTNVNLENNFTVFSIRNLEDVLRPIAMFMILDYIWTKIKNNLKKRLLLLDEAWTLMQYPDSATFVYSIAKRARKYYLGLTTITQDVADFLKSDYGKAVVTNSSIQILLRQHPASIDNLSNVFYLSQGERNFLLSAAVGEGLFFAGSNHVAMKIKASPEEHKLITTDPREVMEIEKEEDYTEISKTPDEQIEQIQKVIEQMKSETIDMKNDAENLEWNPIGKPQVGSNNNTVVTPNIPQTSANSINENSQYQSGNNLNEERNNTNSPQVSEENSSSSYNSTSNPWAASNAPKMPNPYANIPDSQKDNYYQKGSILIN